MQRAVDLKLKIMNIRDCILIMICCFIFNQYFMKKYSLQDSLYLYYKNIHISHKIKTQNYKKKIKI